MSVCIDCGKKIDRHSKARCWKCYTKSGFGKNNPNYRGGKPKCLWCKQELKYYDKNQKFHRKCRTEYCKKNPQRNPVKNSEGYILIYKPEHPNARKDGYIFEHRLVLEKKLGRYLLPEEIPHHMNHIRNDNRSENLMLLIKKDHDKLHLNLIRSK